MASVSGKNQIKDDKNNHKENDAGLDINKKGSTLELKETAKKDSKEVKEKKDYKKYEGIDAYRVIFSPVITEKSTNAAMLNKYTFEVSVDANKIEIKKAFFNLYGVMPISVNLLMSKGKNIRFGKVKGRRKDSKKAIVALKKGQTIDLTPNI